MSVVAVEGIPVVVADTPEVEVGQAMAVAAGAVAVTDGAATEAGTITIGTAGAEAGAVGDMVGAGDLTGTRGSGGRTTRITSPRTRPTQRLTLVRCHRRHRLRRTGITVNRPRLTTRTSGSARSRGYPLRPASSTDIAWARSSAAPRMNPGNRLTDLVGSRAVMPSEPGETVAWSQLQPWFKR